MLVPHWDPKSVIQRAPMSGAFGTDDYLCDKEGFIAGIMAHWLCHSANKYTCETIHHLESAESLFDYYLAYRKKAKSEKWRGSVLLILYRTGDVSKALNENEVGMSQVNPTFYEYGGKQYKPCGVCDVCTMPELAYSDCGQPVMVDLNEIESVQERA